ncbi:MAG: hypothetical protein L0K41_07305 [Yaniella sp.]|uniref:hypothetical protein n=1 Tax=Brevibacterium sp. TaxID=1701 RepID=UPI00264A2866|nr:hypothetical protein [Brevibacterium sp.]MDN6490194.1 hypothetical protein [Yaniella sp.]MDN5806532.1 hypothetical protein [Brevibacterium sp.]MDN5833136.1 hypothetical protein [Brevibacterium sp.]MDN5876930.1 hypothetical protein [Brevibacterium sp.]MDN5908689.1 hypothetical protein [Brevibacterium sp.]
MTRTPSAIRTRSNRGVAISERDLNRLRLLGRWHSLTAEHIARSEQPPALWSPGHRDALAPEARAEFTRAVEAAKRRLRTLKSIEDDPGIGLGPLLGTALAPNGSTAYFATRIGARTAGLPWNLRNTINPNVCQHAWMAADIGMALESAGYRVLSEREIATGIDRHGDEITAQLESEHNANGRTTGKRPDVAVLHTNGRDYIAIEAERDTDRAISVYEQKLSAYASNPAIRAVWYICASDTTAKRVGQGAQKAFGGPGSFPLRITTIPSVNGHHFLDMNALPKKFALDLSALSDIDPDFADDGLTA